MDAKSLSLKFMAVSAAEQQSLTVQLSSHLAAIIIINS